MGGNALSETRTRRYTAGEYHALSAEVVSSLTAALPGIRVEAVKAYATKPDFGDLDVLVDTACDRAVLERHLRGPMGVEELVKNGPVWSLGYRDFQVDLIFEKESRFDFAASYFAYNDLGNLIGRTAHRMGFKFCHDALRYVVRDGTYVVAELELTTIFPEALTFLGYAAERHAEGFEHLSDVFDYAASSEYFHPDSFSLELRSHKARVRDAKRPSYRAFLAYLEERGLTGSPVYNEGNDPKSHRPFFLARAREQFPQFDAAYVLSTAQHERRRASRERYNGELVAEWTGLAGKELGNLMRFLREQSAQQFPCFETWLLGCGPDDARQWALEQVMLYNKSEAGACTAV